MEIFTVWRLARASHRLFTPPAPFGIATSTDEGESWEYHEFPKYHETDTRSYCRGMALKADDPNVIFVGNGNTIPGMNWRHPAFQGPWKDLGSGSAACGAQLSLMYWFATHASIPNVIVAASLFGYVYTSEDGGDSWQKLRKEFGEIRSLALAPN